MSRVGKRPIFIPQGVEVKIEDNKVIIRGPKGQLNFILHPKVKVKISNKEINVSVLDKDDKESRALWGLTRTLIANMVLGVVQGFEKKLEIEGVGFRASLEGNDLVLFLGFSHPIKVKAPEGINFKIEKKIITISGIDKQLVGQLAAQIRSIKPPEPYKGKGIRFLGEQVRIKPGKKAVAAEGKVEA